MDSRSTSKDFPGFDKIFLLEESGKSRAFRGQMDVETDGIGLTRAEVHPPQPLTVEWAMGRAKPVEVIWTTHAVPILVADSVVQLLRSHEFTGWSLYDITVRDKQGQRVPDYSGLAITGRCGKIDRARTIMVPRIYPAGIFPVGKGIFFDPASWDGSDFFMPGGHVGWTFVVQEVKQAFEKAKIRNVEFTPLEQVEVDWPQ